MRRDMGVFVLAALIAAAVVGERVGQADCQASPTNYRSFHPVDCTAVAGSGNVQYVNTGQIENNSTSAIVELWCQAPHDSYLPLNSGGTLELTVTGWNTGCTSSGVSQYCGSQNPSEDCAQVAGGTSNMCARACRTFYGGSGGNCGTWQGDGGTSGIVHIHPALTWWNGTNAGAWDDTYFVDVFLCQAANWS